MSPSEDPRILGALQAGNKIAAIKLYRDLCPGTGLAEAKAAIETIEAGLHGQARGKSSEGSRPAAASGSAANDPEVLQAIYAGEKIKAIKLYRKAHPGAGLAEAKNEIELSSAELYKVSPEKFTRAPQAASGCLGLVLAAPLAGWVMWRILH